eukprot:TRINITY_DN1340_c2_g1_i2.p1 TRINITY_DN1340_c2_g1~~TRINITY_DN1340_c2_g1_i2.p1  ORF type:complete len:504 (+),score=80.64 TRINITY_DN1340_c2_g1_i2:64-1575(+)
MGCGASSPVETSEVQVPETKGKVYAPLRRRKSSVVFVDSSPTPDVRGGSPPSNLADDDDPRRQSLMVLVRASSDGELGRAPSQLGALFDGLTSPRSGSSLQRHQGEMNAQARRRMVLPRRKVRSDLLDSDDRSQASLTPRARRLSASVSSTSCLSSDYSCYSWRRKSISSVGTTTPARRPRIQHVMSGGSSKNSLLFGEWMYHLEALEAQHQRKKQKLGLTTPEERRVLTTPEERRVVLSTSLSSAAAVLSPRAKLCKTVPVVESVDAEAPTCISPIRMRALWAMRKGEFLSLLGPECRQAVASFLPRVVFESVGPAVAVEGDGTVLRLIGPGAQPHLAGDWSGAAVPITPPVRPGQRRSITLLQHHACACFNSVGAVLGERFDLLSLDATDEAACYLEISPVGTCALVAGGVKKGMPRSGVASPGGLLASAGEGYVYVIEVDNTGETPRVRVQILLPSGEELHRGEGELHASPEPGNNSAGWDSVSFAVYCYLPGESFEILP